MIQAKYGDLSAGTQCRIAFTLSNHLYIQTRSAAESGDDDNDKHAIPQFHLKEVNQGEDVTVGAQRSFEWIIYLPVLRPDLDKVGKWPYAIVESTV